MNKDAQKWADLDNQTDFMIHQNHSANSLNTGRYILSPHFMGAIL
ncbi:MAG: hypothetical protein QM796_20730 [Chthoniobacteraceae bacterium]